VNTTVIIKLPLASTHDVQIQMLALTPQAGHPRAVVQAGVVRLTAGDEYGFEVCKGMSLCITDVERAQ
jgi:hypothetical protein